MASKQTFIILVVVLIVLPAVAMAKQFMVGDDSGWTIGFDYQAWAQGKDFRVGDKLVFKYPVGAHNVHKVSGTPFQDCVIPSGTEAALKSGNDEITLATPGRKWYICGVGKHCEVGGQRLFITVLPKSAVTAPAPSPIALSSSYGMGTYKIQALVIAAVFLMMIVTA